MEQQIRAFNILAKPIGPICNLACDYCFYLEKEILYHHKSNWVMSDLVLESFIRQKIEAHQVPQVNFAWQGGEPTLLGVDFFKKVVAYQQQYANGKIIGNAFQTNGILIDEKWCEFFTEHNFLIGLSIDGPQDCHDRYRKTKGGKSTFEQVLRAMEFLKKHQVQFNTLTCINNYNAKQPLQVYNFLKENGSGFMQFIPIVERIAQNVSPDSLKLVPATYSDKTQISEWSVDPFQFGKFLCAIFDEWVRKDVGNYFVQTFDVALESWMQMPSSLCLFRETCGEAMVIEHNGDLYSCDHFVFPENRLGNILDAPLSEMVHSQQQRQFGKNKRDELPQYCLDCDVLFACFGECPKNRFAITPDGEPGLNYLCPGYKLFFEHIDRYMQFMANELHNQRPPANVKNWIRQIELDISEGRVGRNDPCPCGSGKKVKKCCGK